RKENPWPTPATAVANQNNAADPTPSATAVPASPTARIRSPIPSTHGPVTRMATTWITADAPSITAVAPAIDNWLEVPTAGMANGTTDWNSPFVPYAHAMASAQGMNPRTMARSTPTRGAHRGRATRARVSGTSS